MSYSGYVQIQEHVPLAPLTTLHIGGPARFFCRVETEAELLEGVAFARDRNLPLFILGGGSNLVVSDEGFPGLVLHLVLTAPTRVTQDESGFLFDVAAGTNWDDFVQEACAAGLSGVECLAGIPGLTGGTPVQNVGAYGQEVSQTIVQVSALDLHTMALVQLSHEQCGFSYRRSIFNSAEAGRYVVTAVRFRLRTETRPNISYADLKQHFAGCDPSVLDVAHAVREIRRAKGMLLVDGDPDCRSAGSFFKNPVVPLAWLESVAATLNLRPEQIPNWPTGRGTTKLPAAWILERAGFHKGFVLGAAGISSRHTLALINRGEATCKDLLRLRDTIVAEVKRRFDVSLEQEPVYLGS